MPTESFMGTEPRGKGGPLRVKETRGSDLPATSMNGNNLRLVISPRASSFQSRHYLHHQFYYLHRHRHDKSP